MMKIVVEAPKEKAEELMKSKIETKILGKFEKDECVGDRKVRAGTIWVEWTETTKEIPVFLSEIKLDPGSSIAQATLEVPINCFGTDDYYNLLTEVAKILRVIHRVARVTDVELNFDLEEYDTFEGRLYDTRSINVEIIRGDRSSVFYGTVEYTIYEPNWKEHVEESYIEALDDMDTIIQDSKVMMEVLRRIFSVDDIWESDKEFVIRVYEGKQKGLNVEGMLRVAREEVAKKLNRGIHWKE